MPEATVEDGVLRQPNLILVNGVETVTPLLVGLVEEAPTALGTSSLLVCNAEVAVEEVVERMEPLIGDSNLRNLLQLLAQQVISRVFYAYNRTGILKK